MKVKPPSPLPMIMLRSFGPMLIIVSLIQSAVSVLHRQGLPAITIRPCLMVGVRIEEMKFDFIPGMKRASLSIKRVTM